MSYMYYLLLDGAKPVAELTKEQYEELPEFLKTEYIEDNDGYSHKGMMKVKQTANELDAKLKAAGGELNDYKSAEQERIDAATKAAYEKALKDGNSEEIAKRHAEQLADAEQRALERGKSEAKEEFTKEQNANKADKIALKIAGEIGVDEYAKDLIYQAIRAQVSHDSGSDIFLDDGGRATSLNYETFKESVKNNPRYARLVDDTPAANGGGNAKGSTSGRASGKKFNELTGAELSALRKENSAEYDRLKNEFYN